MNQNNHLDAMIAISNQLEAGENDAARRRLADLIANFQTVGVARIFASACFERLGERERAQIEAGIALALEPNNSAVCKTVAHYLEQDGQRDAAQRVLEHGWEQMKKHYPKKRWTDERTLYFAFSEDSLPPHLLARRRTERSQMEADLQYVKQHWMNRGG